MRFFGWAFLGAGWFATGLLAAAAPPQPIRHARSDMAESRPIRADAEPNNWLTQNGNYAEQRYSPLDRINPDTVGRLGLAWVGDLESTRGQESTPLVVDGTLYVTTAWSKVVAFDAVTGAVKWRFDPKVPGRAGVNACCDVVNRGAAYDDGKIFVGTIDGRLIAIDAKTGRQVWSVQTTDPTRPYTITGAPRAFRGKVVIGNGGAEYAVRGYVTAYDVKTGRLVWRFYTVPGDPKKRDGAASDEILNRLARPTWFGDAYYKYGGGGTAWDSIVYDPELRQLYIGVGNGGPWDRHIRSAGKGDNLFLGSIVAVDPDTGRYLWHYQETPGDSWDFTSTQQMVLSDLRIDGRVRKVILHAPKNGFFYVVDRTTGKLISAEKYAAVNWADRIDLATGRPVENPDARYGDKPFIATSGPAGAHDWRQMSFNPKTGLVYIPVHMIGHIYMRDPAFRYSRQLWNTGLDISVLHAPDTTAEIAAMKTAVDGRLIAWDPVRQKEVWHQKQAALFNGGVLSTGGGLVFEGLGDATFRAYRADTGQEVWRFDAQSPILPGAISYEIGGQQYIAVTVGFGGNAIAAPYPEGPRTWPGGRMMVFRLGGTAKLPPLETVAPAAPNPAAESFPPAMVAEGEKLYGRVCSACHALGAQSGGVVPDLRRSAALSDSGAWRQIVLGGILTERGMVSFARDLTPHQAEAIRAYVSGRARKVMSPTGH